MSVNRNCLLVHGKEKDAESILVLKRHLQKTGVVQAAVLCTPFAFSSMKEGETQLLGQENFNPG